MHLEKRVGCQHHLVHRDDERSQWAGRCRLTDGLTFRAALALVSLTGRAKDSFFYEALSY